MKNREDVEDIEVVLVLLRKPLIFDDLVIRGTEEPEEEFV